MKSEKNYYYQKNKKGNTRMGSSIVARLLNLKKINKWIALMLIFIMIIQPIIQTNMFSFQIKNAKAASIDDSTYSTACNKVQQQIENAGDIQDPSTPENLIATTVTGSAITLTWDDSTDNDVVIGYKIFRDDIEIGISLENNYTDSTLKQQGTYNYTVQAYDASNNLSDASIPISVIVNDIQTPLSPVNLTASTVSGTSIVLTWDASLDNDRTGGYSIYRDEIEIGTSIETNYTDSTSKQQGTYNYTVKAHDVSNNLSDASIPISVIVNDPQTLLPPMNLTANTVSGTAIALTWDDSLDDEGTAGYKIYRDDIEIGTSLETYYTDFELSQGSTYTYTVKTYDASNNLSDSSNPITITVIDLQAPTAPVNLKVTAVTGTEVVLTWGASTDNVGVVGYIVYRDNVEIGTTNETHYNDLNLTQGETYTYTVKAQDAANNLSEASDCLSTEANDSQAPTVPANLTAATVTGTEIILKWDASTDNVGVVGYDVYLGQILIGSIMGDSTFVVTGLEYGLEYTFTIEAKDEAGNISELSDLLKVRTLPQKPMNLNAIANETGISITWKEVVGADGYELSINGDIIEIGNHTAYDQTQILTNCKYEYLVRTVNSSGKSEWSDSTKIYAAPGKVLNLKAKAVDESSIDLTWDIVEGALLYEVEINGDIVGVVAENKYTHSDIAADDINNYRVRAISGDLKGIWSDSILKATRVIISEGTIIQDTIWGSSGGVYIVNGNVTIAKGVTLQVMPGTIVKFNAGKGLTVSGTLLAQGTPENPIIFTAVNDSECGGSGELGEYDRWIGINVESTGEFTGNNVKINYGGYYYYEYNYDTDEEAFIDCNKSSLNVQGILNLSNSEVLNSYQDGIIISSENDVIIQNTTIQYCFRCINIDKSKANIGTVTLKDNDIYGAICGINVCEVGDSGLIIENNSIRECSEAGITIEGHGTGTFNLSENTISNNETYPIEIILDEIKSSIIFSGISNNIFSENHTANYIALRGYINKNLTLSDTNTYVVDWISVSSNNTLTIQPGTVVLCKGGYYYEGISTIDVYGKLIAKGTPENPIVFTALKDLDYGGSGVWWGDDYWIGINIESSGEFEGDNVKIKYGGYYGFNRFAKEIVYNYYNKSALYIQGVLNLSNSKVLDSLQAGIRISSDKDVLIQNTSIQNTENTSMQNSYTQASKYGIYIDKKNVNTGTVTLRNNIIYNSESGISVCEAGDSGSIIENNLIQKSGDAGIIITGHSTGTFNISENAISNQATNPILLILDEIKLSTVVLSGISNNLISEDNTAFYLTLRGCINEDITLAGTYIVDWISVPMGKTLTIQPGTLMLFRSYFSDQQNTDAIYNIDVYGKLIAQGTTEEPIILTSTKDPEFGGDGIYNNDYTNYWKGIYVADAGEFDGNNLKVKYSGNTWFTFYVFGILNLYNSDILLTMNESIGMFSDKNATIQNSVIDRPMIVQNDSGTFTFKNNILRGHLFIDRLGDSSFICENNHIEGYYTAGIEISGTSTGLFSLKGNNITNSQYPIDINFFHTKSLDEYANLSDINNFYGNIEGNFIALGGDINEDITIPHNTKFILSNRINILEGKTLTIQPGVILLAYASINVSGTLIVQGTDEMPVIMTSKSDSYYGESGVNQWLEYWGGITVYNTGKLEASYLTIKNGNTNIEVYGSANITNSVISNSYSDYGILFNTNIQPTLFNNTFMNNAKEAVYNKNSNIVINAKNNYWNSFSGPTVYKQIYNASTKQWTWAWVGTGEKISNKVDYTPYLGVETTNAAHYNQTQGTYAPSGNYSRQYTDLSVKCLEDTLMFIRSYNSQDIEATSVFGKGWSLNFESNITDHKYLKGTKSVILPEGGLETYTMNSDGSFTSNESRNTLMKQTDGTYILTTNSQMKYGYNTEGRLIWIESKAGNRLTISLGTNGKPQVITDYVGRDYKFIYTNNLLTSISDSQGRTVNYIYENNRLVKVIDPEGVITTYVYDVNGNLSEIRDGSNNVVESIAYITSNGCLKVDHITDVYGNTKTYSYDVINSKTTITDNNGRVITEWYNSIYNITYITDPEGKTSSIVYLTGADVYKYNEIKSQTDYNGNTTTYDRDSNGNIIKVTNPDGSYKQYSYDGKNNLTSERDEAGKYTYYIYDTTSTYLLKEIRPLNGTDIYSASSNQDKYAITTYTYIQDGENGNHIKGLIKSITDPEGKATTYSYDNYGNKETETDSFGNITAFTYNNAGLKTSTLSPKGERTRYYYNNNGNLVTLIEHGGETTSIIYDELGRKIQEIKPNNYQFTPTGDVGYRYTYYISGKIHTITDPENNITTYTYDIYGNMLSETKPNGCIYGYEYDVLDRVKKVFLQDSIADDKVLLKSYSYSILSDKKTQTIETVYLNVTATAITTYVYDYADRLVKQINSDGGIISTTYNTNGTIYSITDAMGKITYYKYDGLNRLTEQWVPFGDSKYTYKTITYNKNSNITTEKTGLEAVALWNKPTTLITTSYVYDNNNRLKTVTDPANGITEYEYDANGNVTKETVYRDSTDTSIIEYEYNYLGKVQTIIKHVEAGDIYGNDFDNTTDSQLLTAYTYDANGNVKTMTKPNGVTTTYLYDNLDRLITQEVQGLDEYGNSTTIVSSKNYDCMGNVIRTVDANGNITRNRYNQRGLLDRIIDPEGGITTYYYDNADRLMAKVLPVNYIEGAALSEMSRMVFTYDSMNRVILEQDVYFDELGITKIINSKAYKYDLNGNKIKTLDALGYNSGSGSTIVDKINSGYGTTYTYNDTNLLLTTLSPVSKDNSLNFDVKFTYDAAGRKISETNADSVVTKYYYDNMGRLIRKSIICGNENVLRQLTYDGMGNILTETDGNGNVTIYSYNSLSLLRSKLRQGDATINNYVIRNQYNSLGQLVYQMDSMSKVITYSYNYEGQILTQSERKEDGTQYLTTSNAYDKNGNIRFVTDANGVTTENSYDGLNRIIQLKASVNGVEHITSYTYDKNSNLLTTTDWLGNTYINEYDDLNRLIKKIDPYEKVIAKYEYNDNHVQIKAYDSLNNATVFAYDKNNRLISTTDPTGYVKTQTYDRMGNIATKKDGMNNVYTYSYDELNRLIKVINAKNEITSYTYDLNNNQLTQKDDKGNTITFTYNAANLLVKRIEPKNEFDISRTDSYTYYSNGAVKTKTDKKGNLTIYMYDIHGNLLSETVGNNVITYTYDNIGNTLTMTDETGMTSRSYDELGRVLTKSVPNVGLITFNYDVTSGVTQGSYMEIATDPESNVTKTVYDKSGRLSKVIVGNDVTLYNYYDNGNRARVTYEDGSLEEYSYFSNNKIQKLVNKKSDGSIMDSYTYTYDNAGNQLTKNEVINGSVKGTTTYTYDTLNRLITVIEPNGRNTAYAYDSVGNRLTETISYNSIITLNSYTYNNLNRLTNIITKINNVLTKETSYIYDENGNQLTTTIKTYLNGIVTSETITASNTYDLHNQLMDTVTEDGTIVNNIYNGEGYRVGKKVDGIQTYYLYVADKVVLEVDEAGNQVASNVYGTNLLMRTVEGETYYYMYNGHADVTALITSNGNIAATYYYDAFGNILESMGDVNNNILYSGYQYDVETGLYYLNARYYDSVTARFITEDTYTGTKNDPLSLNLYTYCQNNPIIYTDPTGHSIKSVLTSFGDGIRDSLKDTGKAFKDLGKTAVKAVKHPVETYTEYYIAKKNSKPTGEVIAAKIVEVVDKKIINGSAEDKAHAAGYITCEVVQAVAADGIVEAVKGVSVASKGAKAVKAVKTVDKIDKISDISKAEKTIVEVEDVAKGGSQTIEVNGKNVTIDNSTFDSNLIDKQGRTNIQRMEQGLSPIGTDGKSVNIHHIDQTNDGPVMEITATEHQTNYSNLHTNTGQTSSQIDRSAFNSWRNEYWKWRSNNIK